MVERALTCTLCNKPSSSQNWRGAPVCDRCLDTVNSLSFLAVGGNKRADKLLKLARKKAQWIGKDSVQSVLEYASQRWGEEE